MTNCKSCKKKTSKKVLGSHRYCQRQTLISRTITSDVYCLV